MVSDPYQPGVYIDMESIYGKVGKRNRRIDIVLGIVKEEVPREEELNSSDHWPTVRPFTIKSYSCLLYTSDAADE